MGIEDSDLIGSRPPGNRQEERAAKRYPCSGKARIVTSSGATVDGRMFDISMTGASVLLDDRANFGTRCTIAITVYKGGTLHNIQATARFVHASLAGQSGFKHGFEFDSPDAAAVKSLAALTNTPVASLI